jgi:hypothetical protein
MATEYPIVLSNTGSASFTMSLGVPVLAGNVNVDFPAVGGTVITSLTQVLPFTRYPVADQAYVASGTDNKIIAYTSLSAGRAVTLPAPTTSGQICVVIDESGSCSGTNLLTMTPASGTIDGQASAILGTPYGSMMFVADGTSKWTIVKTKLRSASYLANGSSWGCPAGVYFVYLLMCGAGGGGGGATANLAGCGGGGGQVIAGWYPVVPGTSYSVTIGTGGPGGSGTAQGSAGGSSSFGAVATAYGGGAGYCGSFQISGAWWGSNVGAYGGGSTNGSFFLPQYALGGAATYMTGSPYGCGGVNGPSVSNQPGGSGGSTNWAIGGAGGAGTATPSSLPGGGGGGASLGNGPAGAAATSGGATGNNATANSGAGGGGGGGGGTRTGGTGGSGACYVYWVEN